MPTLKIHVSEVIYIGTPEAPKIVFVHRNIVTQSNVFFVETLLWPSALANAPGRVFSPYVNSIPTGFLS